MGCSVAEAQQRISSREYTGWECYTELYGPIGPEREDYHAALIAQMLYEINRGKAPSRPLEDFLLFKAPDESSTLMDKIAARLPLRRKTEEA